MHTRHPLIIILCFLCCQAVAQERFAKGFLVTNEGDTLRGLIELRETDYNPSEITFKSSQDSQATVYTVSEVRSFSVVGISAWERYTLPINMDPIHLKEVEGYSAPPAVRKTVFLKILQKGKNAVLFSYRDELKIRFYVVHSESREPQELVYKFIRVGGKFAEIYAFRDLLTFIAERSGVMTEDLRSQIKRARYSEPQLLAVVSRMNGVEPEKIRIQNKVGTGFRVGAGVNISRLHYYGKEEFAVNARSSPSSAYWFSVGYDLAAHPMIGALVFRTDVAFTYAEFATVSHDYRYTSDLDFAYSFKQRTGSLGFYVLYNIYNRQTFKFFVSPGLRLNVSVYDYTYEMRRTSVGTVEIFSNNDAEPKRNWVSVPLKIGIVVQKFELGVAYSPTSVLNNGDFIYKYGINSIQGGAIYHF
ncbi:MAG TPA: hypothetical protein VF490_01845 [Chryseosolibacter sp.]